MHRHNTCLHTLWITNSVVHGDSKKSGQSAVNTVIEDMLSHAVGELRLPGIVATSRTLTTP